MRPHRFDFQPIIRPLRREDLPVVATMRAADLDVASQAQVYVVETDGGLIGYGVGQRGSASLDQAFLMPKWRGLGITRMLAAHVRDAARREALA